MSIVKKVPEIRFEGFGREWEEIVLASACLHFRSGKFIKAEDIKKIGIYPVYGGNGLRGYTSEYNHEGTYALIGRQGALCGNMNFSNGKAFFTEHAIAVQANEKNDTLFLYYKLGLMNLGQYSGQSAQPGLSVNKLTELEIFSPAKTEQTQIGNYFQKLDELINQHQQKHDKLSSIKKAMLEKMFPQQGETIPEIRFKGFSGEWGQSNLGECTDLLTGNPFNSKEFTNVGIFLVRGMNVKRGYLETSPEASQFWPSSKGLENYFLKPEDIVIQMDGALIGRSYAKIKACNLPALLVQRVTRVRCSEVNSEFIYQYIQRDFLNHISGIKTETAVPHLSLHDIRNFSILLPIKTEQNRIGNYFQKLDSLINQHQQQIIKLNNIKQACLSKMFV